LRREARITTEVPAASEWPGSGRWGRFHYRPAWSAQDAETTPAV